MIVKRCIIKPKNITLLFLTIIIFISFLSSAALTLNAEPAESSGRSNTDETWIGVLSDPHIDQIDSAGSKLKEKKLRNALLYLKEFSGDSLDAVAFAGDIANNGLDVELAAFKSIIIDTVSDIPVISAMGNHDFYRWGWGMAVDTDYKRDVAQNSFEQYTGSSAEQEIVANGIHILTVSPDNERNDYRSREEFLREKITAANEEDSDKPIIIVAHKPVFNTIMTSGTPEYPDDDLFADWSDSFVEFMNNYPQIIYISGHAHDNIGSSEAIFQQNFTSIHAGICTGDPMTGLMLSVSDSNVVTVYRINFTRKSCFEPSWVIDIPAVKSDPSNYKYRTENFTEHVSVTVGEDDTHAYINWENSTPYEGIVQIGKKSDYINGALENFEEFTCRSYMTQDYKYANHAYVSGLEPGADYVYRVGNSNGFGEYYNLSPKDSSSGFSALVIGDPEITSSADILKLSDGLANAADLYSDTSMIICTGDVARHSSNASLFDRIYDTDLIHSLPWAFVAGERDLNSEIYSERFLFPNTYISTQIKSVGESTSDYWFVRGNALFMCINSNNTNASAHRNFMQHAMLDAGEQIKWKIVVMHHSIFGSSEDASGEDILLLRNSLAPIFSDLGVDLVLSGHDHTYTRSYMMDGLEPQATRYVQSSVTDPADGQVLYVALNSSTSSKYSALAAKRGDYCAVALQNNQPAVTNLSVTDTELSVNTYSSANMTELDSFTIRKTDTAQTDNVKPYIFIDSPDTIPLGSEFSLLDNVSAIDNADGNITDKISVIGTCDTNTAGIYTVTYTAADRAGNTARLDRKITVKEIITGFYYGFDINSASMSDEEGSRVTASYSASSGCSFKRDTDLLRNILSVSSGSELNIKNVDIANLDKGFTIEMYLYIPYTINSANIFSIDDMNINLTLLRNSTKFGVGVNVFSNAEISYWKRLDQNGWTHVVCTVENGRQALYMNGEKIASGNYEDLRVLSGRDSTIKIGGRYYGSGNILYSCFRIYGGFTDDEGANELYQECIKNSAYTYLGKYRDLNPEAWYMDYIYDTVKKGYFSGVNDNMFLPDIPMSRAMFVTVLSRIAGVDLKEYSGNEPRFDDVLPDQWFYNAVVWASENDIVNGISTNVFDPDGNITREQMCAMIVRYADKFGIDISGDRGELPFSDKLSIGEWAQNAVRRCYFSGLVSGMTEDLFVPSGNATRAQVSAIISRLSDKIH